MKVYVGEKVDLTETMSLLYVKNLEKSTCPPNVLCVWEGRVIPVINLCLASSCGCSLEACSSEQTELRGGYKSEWTIPVGEYILILRDIQSREDNRGDYLMFEYYIESQ